MMGGGAHHRAGRRKVDRKLVRDRAVLDVETPSGASSARECGHSDARLACGERRE